MDLPWGDERSKHFITNVGLITSTGPEGPNIMAAEWTHQVSYRPALMAVHIHKRNATYRNIAATKEFGINIASSDQNVLSSVAGGYSGVEFDKFEAAKELGFRFRDGAEIDAPMVEGSVITMECRVVQEIVLGDHVMIVGEVLSADLDTGKKPLVYHHNTYWEIGPHIERPVDAELDHIRQTVRKHSKAA